MLTSLWSNGFLSYGSDVGLWFHIIKYGIYLLFTSNAYPLKPKIDGMNSRTWHKQNLDKVIATMKGK